MPFYFRNIVCQDPRDRAFLDKSYMVVEAIFNDTQNTRELVRQRARELAASVCPFAANKSSQKRDAGSLQRDALGGVLAELAWFHFINRIFGQGTTDFTDFTGSAGQIDLRLANGSTIEVRSSFPKNGIKFALCHARHNFKNICLYSNLYKKAEMEKSFFACVLFATPKDALLQTGKISCWLAGGSTCAMMKDDAIAGTADLIAENDFSQVKTKYRVIKLKDALDMNGFIAWMKSLGYAPKIQPAPDEKF